MSTSNIVWIVIAAVVAVLLIAAVIIAVSTATRRRRQRQAEEIRERVKSETARVEQRQTLANETAAKARAAQAEAEAKAAEAARLQDRAAMHQSKAATTREQLHEQWKHADRIDPKDTTETRETSGRATQSRDQARSEESYGPVTDAGGARQDAVLEPDNYHDAANHRRPSG